jgi:hypothetical protein
MVSTKYAFYSCCKRVIGDGRQLALGRIAGLVTNRYAKVYVISYNHNITVNTVFTRGFDFLKFTRFLCDETKVLWLQLLEMCSQVRMTDEPDRVT